MSLVVNQAQSIDKLVMTAFSNKTDLVKFLGPIVKLTFSTELKNKIEAHFEQEAELVKEIPEAIQKKNNLNYFVVMPTDEKSGKMYKTNNAIPLFKGNDKDQMVYGYADAPQQIDDSPERINETIQKYCFRHFHIPKDYC